MTPVAVIWLEQARPDAVGPEPDEADLARAGALAQMNAVHWSFGDLDDDQMADDGRRLNADHDDRHVGVVGAMSGVHFVLGVALVRPSRAPVMPRLTKFLRPEFQAQPVVVPLLPWPDAARE